MARANITFRLLNDSDLEPGCVREWAALEERALEPNAYLSPCFVLPALKHLTPRRRALFILAEDGVSECRKLCGVGIFHHSAGTKRLPFPHLKAYRSPHSYLSGLLIDRDLSERTLDAFFAFLCKRRHRWFGVEFGNICRDTALVHQMNLSARKLDVPWYEIGRTTRVVLIPEELGNDGGLPFLSSKLKKKYRRQIRLLEQLEPVAWRFRRGSEIDHQCIDTFLHLENAGWKGKQGSSLRSRDNHEAFFEEMIQGFSRSGRAFFTELSVGSKVIASSSNMISGTAGFAFKIGFDPAFARFSPGILNEIQFLQKVRSVASDLDYIDSGAAEGSFMESLWPHRRTLVSGFFATNRLVEPVFAGMDFLRHVKRKLGQLLVSKTWKGATHRR